LLKRVTVLGLMLSGYIKHLREKVGKEKILMPTNACIIINEQGHILMQERAVQKNWGCPGGLMDLEETVLEGVKREVLEETGLEIRNPVLFGIYSGMPHYEATYPNGDMTQSVLMVFLARNFSGQLKSDEESLTLKFFPLDNLPQPLNKHHAEYLGHYQEYVAGKKEIPIIL